MKDAKTQNCEHEPKAVMVGCGSSRRVDGYKCTKCGETDPAKILEAPELREVNPSDLIGWEDSQSQQHVSEIAEAMQDGEDVPPVVVGSSGKTLYDGHHRVAAADKLGSKVKAWIVPQSWSGVVPATTYGLANAIAETT